MRERGSFLATAMVGLLLLAPSAAQAADAYVDFETGDDTGPCGAINDPCKTVVNGIAQAGAGETVRVDDRPMTLSYFSTLGHILGSGKSLVAEEFVGGDESTLSEPDTVIEGGDMVTFAPSIRVAAGDPAGTIEGLRIRSNGSPPVRLEASATLASNIIDEAGGTGSGCFIEVLNGGNTPTIGPGNFMIDPTPSATGQAGVCITTGAAPSISSNRFTNLNHGVQSGGGDTAVTSNTFSGIRGNTNFAAIEVTAGSPMITANLIQQPGDTFVLGIALQGAAAVVGASLRRNTVLGHRVGVVANDTDTVVDLNGDLIAKSSNAGLAINDSPAAGDADVSATNVTVTDSSGFNISLSEASLTLNSSIIGNGGITYSGGATCAISFSRGPTTGAGCDNFQTMAAPGFVDPVGDDYHLAMGSPMIDSGDPAAPVFPQDIDGQGRATDGNGDGVARRDIGADETPTFVATPMPTSPVGTTPGTTGQRAAALKKCKKKKSKRARRNCRKRARKLPV